jgi:SAM-dependent methyltransferase
VKHFYKDVPGWSLFVPLYAEAVKAAPKSGAVFVEIGAWLGRSAAFMGVEIANSRKQIDFYVVDHFKGSAVQIARSEPVLVAGQLYEEFCRYTKPVAKYLKVLPMNSVDAAERFAPESVDFILVDGSHEYEDVLADLRAWYPKLKPGGVIAGDDWRNRGVNTAVRAFFGELGRKIEPIFGRAEKKCWVVR